MEPRVRIVLQARTSSSRLPAKSLLPVGGMALAVLCARRLSATGYEVVLATSEDASDDLLSLIAQRSNLQVFRGSLNNVLQRFLNCTSDLGDEDIVVRATGDNPIPDGRFVGALIGRFLAAGGEYFATTSPDDGLPYGLSAEVFKAGALRQVAAGTPDALDFENVTTTLRRKAGAQGIVEKYAFFDDDLSHLRVTVDTLEDYLAMASLFAQIPSAVDEDWKELVRRLVCRGFTNNVRARDAGAGKGHSSIALGTIQLGQHYGVANKTGRPSEAEAAEMVALALRSGVTYLDTARAYGDSEACIGRLLPARTASAVQIVTKLLPLEEIPDDALPRDVRTAVDASVFRSCRELRRDRIDVLMFHRRMDMVRWNGAALTRLVELMEEGVIGALGASVYAPEEATACLSDLHLTHLQLPFNLLDSRWLAGPFEAALALRKDVRIHVRSVFLQGLLVSDSQLWPEWVEDRDELVHRIESLSESMGRKSRADLCMAYVRRFPWVATMVLGAETLHQLEQLMMLAGEPALTPEQALGVQAVFSRIPERLLNPARWHA